MACWGHHHLSGWPSQRLPWGSQGYAITDSTRGSEGLLNARAGRPQKRVTTADPGSGDMVLATDSTLSGDFRGPHCPS